LKKLRALVVLDERWNSALTDLGFKVALSLSKECEVFVAAISGAPAWEMAKSAKFETLEIADPRKGLPFKPFLTLKRAIEKVKPKVVVTIRGDELLFGALLKKRFGYKLFRIHGNARGIKNSFLNRYLHRKFVDGVLISSKRLVNEVVENLPKILIPGIVNTEVFKFSEEKREIFRKKLGVKNEKLICVVARLDPVKGHKLFLKAISKLKRNDFKAVIVGEEKNVRLSELQSLAVKLGIKNKVVFINKKIEDVAGLMCACDLGVVPSVGSEVIARVPLEFMACRTALVSTNVGVLPEIITSPFGITVPPEEEPLARAIDSFLDRDLSKLGKIASEVALEKYSFSAVSPVINDFILGRL
jgi:glycosyltransferase involved in cell wall biosynthesis